VPGINTRAVGIESLTGMDGMKTQWGNGWNGNSFPLSQQGLTVWKTQQGFYNSP